MSNAVLVRPIRNDEDFDAAMKRVSEIIHAKPGTPEADEMEVLYVLINAYDKAMDPNPPKDDPIETLKFWMDQRDLKPMDLVPYIGNKGRVYDILGKRRPLTLAMIRSLSKGLGIPVQYLVGA